MRHLEFPFSYYRPHVDTPETVPAIDQDKFLKLDGFLQKHKLIVVDDVAGSYRYGQQKFAASPETLKRYIGYRDYRKYIAQELVGNPEGQIFDLLEDVEAKSRQVKHVAENAEINLGMFYGLALMRHRALGVTIKNLEEQDKLPDDLYTRHCADAIIDMGQAMLNPSSIPAPTARNRKYSEQDALDMQGFGMYAHETDRDVLGSDDGLFVMKVVKREQNRRIQTFGPRYDALITVVGSQLPNQQISPDMTDNELLGMQFIASSDLE